MPGAHNAQNAAAAYLICRSVGAPRRYRLSHGDLLGLPHRQLAAVIDEVRYVNDSKATNPEAAASTFSYNEIYWIAGGRAKEGPLDVIHPFLPHVDAYLIGGPRITLLGNLPIASMSSCVATWRRLRRAPPEMPPVTMP